MWSWVRDWLPLLALGAVGIVYVGYLVGSFRKGKDASSAAAEATATAAIAAQGVLIATQEKTIANLQFEFSALREEHTRTQTRLAAVEAELAATKELNAILNQMPPKEQLAALAADATMHIVELMSERLAPIERGVTRLLTVGNGEALD